MAKENETPKNGRSVTSVSPQTMEIALGKETISTTGDGALEHVIVSSIAQVVFGSDKGNKATTIANLKNAGADGGGLVGAIENSSTKILKKLDEVKKSIDDIPTIAKNVIAKLTESPLIVSLAEDSTKQPEKKPTSDKLDINIVTSPDVAQTFASIAALAESDVLENVGEAFEHIVIMSQDFSDINENIAPFVSGMSALIDKKDGISILTNLLKDLKNEANVLSEFNSANTDGFKTFVSSVGNLTKQIEDIKSFVTNIKSIDIDSQNFKAQISNLQNVVSDLESIELPEKINLADSNFISALESYVNLINNASININKLSDVDIKHAALKRVLNELQQSVEYFASLNTIDLNKIDFSFLNKIDITPLNNLDITINNAINSIDSILDVIPRLTRFKNELDNLDLSTAPSADKFNTLIKLVSDIKIENANDADAFINDSRLLSRKINSINDFYDNIKTLIIDNKIVDTKISNLYDFAKILESTEWPKKLNILSPDLIDNLQESINYISRISAISNRLVDVNISNGAVKRVINELQQSLEDLSSINGTNFDKIDFSFLDSIDLTPILRFDKSIVDSVDAIDSLTTIVPKLNNFITESKKLNVADNTLINNIDSSLKNILSLQIDKNSVDLFVNTVKNITLLNDNVNVLSETLNKFDNIELNYDSLTNKFNDTFKFAEFVNSLQWPSSIDSPNLQLSNELQNIVDFTINASNSLEKLRDVNIQDAIIMRVSKDLNNSLNALANFDMSVAQKIDFSPLSKIDLTYLKSFDDTLVNGVEAIESLLNSIPRINNFIEELNNIEEIQNEDFDKLNSFISKLSNIKLSSVAPISSDFLSFIKDMTFYVLPGIGELSEELKDNAFVSLTDDKIQSINSILNGISLIKLDKDAKFELSLPSEFATTISSLTSAMPSIKSFIDSIEDMNSPNMAKINELKEILNSLNKIEFNNNAKIDARELVEFISSLIPVSAILTSFDDSFADINVDNLLNASKNLAVIFSNLAKIEFEPSGNINDEWLQDLLDSQVIKNVSLIGKSLNENKESFNDEIVKLSGNLVYVLYNLEKIKYDPKHPITSESLDKLNLLEYAIGNEDKGLAKMLEFVSSLNLKKSTQNINQLVKSIAILSKIDTDKFAKKDFKNVKDAAKTIESIASSVEKISNVDKKAIGTLELFVEKVFDKNGVLSTFAKNVATLNLNKNISDAQNTAKLVKELTDACKTIAVIGTLAASVKLGMKVLKGVITELVDIVKKLSEINANTVKESMSILNDITKLVVVSSMVMLIGAYFIVKNPELVIGAIAFGLTLGLFLFTIINAIRFSSRGLAASLEAMQGITLLVTVSTMVLLIGATFVVNFPELVVGALAFTLLLDLFIFSLLKSINSGAGNMKFAFGVMKDISLLIAVSTMCLVIGATFMTAFPELVVGALEFVGLLDLFIWSILKVINKQAKSMPMAMLFMKDICYLIATASFVLILGGVFMTVYPELAAGALAFGTLLGTFIWGVLKAINKNSSEIQKAIPNAILFATVVGVSASVLLIGGGLLIAFPDLIVTIPIFGTLLAGFTFVMTKILTQLSKNTGNIMKGAAAMAIISGVVLVSASAMVILRKACEGDMLALLAGAGIMVATLGVVALFTATMGALASNQFFWFGIGAVAAIGGIVLMAAGAMLIIAKALETFKQVGKFDIGPALGAITGAITIGLALAPFGLLAPFILVASVAVVSLSVVISKISEAVAEAASLKIPIYEGTKKVGYRQLTKQDFTSAAKNIRAIVTCLAHTMMKIYTENPGMFSLTLRSKDDNPFVRVVKSTTMLASLVSKIAKAVKTYASLTIPLYDDKGNEIGVRNLDKSDFKNAANNVKLIITTLGGALIDVYKNNKEMFADTSIFGPLKGTKPENTPLSIVISVTRRIGKLMSSIAKGVHAMSNLLVANDWDKDGNPIHYINMTEPEIKRAGTNTQFIIETISNSLIDLYNKNPEMYKDSSLFSFMKGDKPGNTPLSIVLSVSMKIGKLMSKVAKGVHAMGKLLVPDQWDKDGNAIHYINMTDVDIKNAGNNTKAIVETISNSLISLYNDHQEMYTDSSLFSFMKGDKPGNTPLSIVLSVSMKIGKLMSSIAKGVNAMGKLLVPDKWDKEGNPIHYEKMSDKDIIQAGKNVENIVTSMALSLMSVYKAKPEWFQSTNWLGMSSPDPKSSPFAAVIAVNLKLSNIISSISKAVASMAKTMIPDNWDKNGNPIHYVQLGEKDFRLAQENISKTIVTIGTAIMGIYDKHKEWFTDSDGDLLKDTKSPFGVVMKSVSSMGELVANISKSVKDIATLQIPIDWDSKGAPTKFRQLEKKDFDLVKENIGAVVSTIGEAIMQVYTDHEKDGWFEEEGNWLTGKSPSKFTTMMNACVSMGEMISGISSGITSMAQLMIPIDWDNSGNPIKFRQMNDADFSNASDAIGKVITCIGGSMIDLYNNDPYDMFKVNEDSENTIFGNVAESCAYLGTMIKDIASGVAEMATLEQTLKKQGINIDFESAAKNIKSVVTAIGGALIETFKDHKDWFENPLIVNETKGGFGLFSKKEVVANTADTPFEKMMTSCIMMGEMILGIAEGISYFATITQKPLPDGSKLDIDTASTNIGNIITAIGNAVVTVASGTSFYNIDKIQPIIDSVQKSANAVLLIARLIEKIGLGEIPVVDKDGNIVSKITINNETIAKAAEMIGNVISGVSAGFATIENNSNILNVFGQNSRINNILDAVNKGIQIVAANAVTLAKISKGEIKIWNNDFSKELYSITFTKDDLSKGGKAIGDILSGIAAGISSAITSFKNKGLGFWLSGEFNKSQVGTLLTAINFAMTGVSANLKTLVYLSAKKFPIYEIEKTEGGGFNYKVKEWVAFSNDNIKNGATAVGDIISCVAQGLGDAIEKLKNTDFWSFVGNDYEHSSLGKLMMAINQAMTIVGTNALTLRNLSVGEIKLFDKNNNIVDTVKFKSSDLTNGATTIADIIEKIAAGVGNGTLNCLGIFGSDTWENTKAYMMLKAVEGAKDTVGHMALFLSHLANNEYTYYDIRQKRERTVSFKSKENLRDAATSIEEIIKSIARGVGNATASISTYLGDDAILKYEASKPYFALEAVRQAKDAIGPFALLLSHLANNEYTYYDTRQKKEMTVAFGSKDDLMSAGTTLGVIIASIGAGVGIAVDSISNAIGDDAIIGNYEKTKTYFALQTLQKAKDAIGPFALFLAKLSTGEFEYNDLATGTTQKVSGIDNDKITATTTTISNMIVNLAKSIAEAADEMESYGWNIFGFGKSSEDKISAMFNSLNKAIPFLGRIAKVISLYSANKATIVENGAETIVDVMDVATASFNIAMIMQSIPRALQEASKEFDKIGDVEKTIGYLNSSYFMIAQLMKSIELISNENASEILSKLPEKAFSSILNPVIEDISLVINNMEKLGNNENSIFSSLAKGPTPIEKFVKDVYAIQEQGLSLRAANINNEYKDMADALGYAVNTLNSLQLPETTVKQVGELGDFIKSMNKMNIHGIESFTKLIEQLNKMGINMGNLDRVANAISDKLSPTLEKVGKQMEDLRKELAKDEARKKKHKVEIEKSVETIKNAMSSTMKVIVSMDENGGGNNNGNAIIDDQDDEDTTKGNIPKQGNKIHN